MEQTDNLKQRLVGAAVLISLVVVFLPMLVDDGPGPSPDRPAVPPRPGWQFSGAQQQEYQPPPLPQRPPVEVIDPGPIAGPVEDPAVEPTQTVEPKTATGTTEPRKPADLIEITVKSGDTLYGIFRRAGLEPSQVRELVKVGGASKTLSRLRPGQRFRIRVDAHKRIIAMEYLHGGGPPLRIKRIDGKLQMASAGQHAPPRSSAAASKPPPRASAQAKPAATPHPSRERGPVAWVVQVGVYKDWDLARALQAKLRGKGYASFLKPETRDGGKIWLLKVGPYLKKADSVTQAQQIQRLTGSKTQVVPHR